MITASLPTVLKDESAVFNRLRDLIRHPLFLPFYIPSIFAAISIGMLQPIIPLYASDFEVSYGLVGLVLAAEALGTLLGDIPAGFVLRRHGQKFSMLAGLTLSGVATTGLFWAGSIPVVIGLLLISGVGRALFNVSRHDFLAEVITVANRGRAIALFGGVHRVGRFAGPAAGGFIAAAAGLRAPFLLYGVLVGAAFLFILLFVRQTPPSTETPAAHATRSRVLRGTAGILASGGSGQLLAQMTRSAWAAIIPLYGADVIGLDVDAIGLIISLMSAVDMTLFYPTGMIMDRFGRKFAIVPSFTLQALGLALIPLTSSFAGLLAVSIFIGFGNGLGSGTMMTLGADLAPPDARGEFLGIWRLIGDAGFMISPLVVGTVADLLALSTASVVMAGGGTLAAGVFLFLVPETLKKRVPAIKSASEGAPADR